MAQASRSLYNALIRRSIDLRALYRDAAAQVREPGLREVLEENAHALDLLIGELQGQVRQGGSMPPCRGRLGSSTRRQLLEWLLPATPHRDHAWIERLAGSEASLLHAFERGIADASAETSVILRRQLPRLQNIHLDMHTLASVDRF